MRSDETGRVYPGVLDYTKFESSTLNDRYGRTGKIAAKLTLTGCRQKTIWHDQELYRLKEPFAQTIGPGAATRQELLIPVSIWQAGTVCPGKLNITVVRPNS